MHHSFLIQPRRGLQKGYTSAFLKSPDSGIGERPQTSARFFELFLDPTRDSRSYFSYFLLAFRRKSNQGSRKIARCPPHCEPQTQLRRRTALPPSRLSRLCRWARWGSCLACSDLFSRTCAIAPSLFSWLDLCERE